MAIVPAVYVTIEDRSFALPSVEATRTGFAVILCDRGEHNKVVQLDTVAEFHTLYGTPDIDKTGQSHYLVDKFLQYGARMYVVRPALINSLIEEENAAIANRFIKYNDVNGSVQKINGGLDIRGNPNGFKFTRDSPTVEVSLVAYEQYDVGDYIFSITDAQSERLKIAAKNTTLIPATATDPVTYTYTFTLSDNYQFAANAVDPQLVKQFAYKYYIGSKPILKIPGDDVTRSTFNFKNGTNIVICEKEDDWKSVHEKQWIYPDMQANSTPTIMRQIINKLYNEITSQWQLTLDSDYTGVSTLDNGNVMGFQSALFYDPFTLETQNNIRDETDFEITDSDNLWYFYSIGPGKFYNRLYIVGTRSVRYEKLYVDNEGVPLYKYAFIDLYVYKQNPDGTSTILEGPFTCSIMRETLAGTVVRDINTGEELYIENIINLHSKFIRCKTTNSSAHKLLISNAGNANGTNPEVLRLYIQKLFANEKVFRTDIVADKGITLESGEDGIQYDEFGRLNLTNNKIRALVINTFRNTLDSLDASVANTQNTLYPWFKFDYIISGGYDKDIQAAARQLADLRNDALLLADTGAISWKPEDDIIFRRNDMAWNTWNAMIYVDYREIFDAYTGRRIWISPVYHAIERHLTVDANYWISEPVAGIEKGAISDPIKLAYKPNVKDMEDLIEEELNCTIVEPDGIYILTQFTTYKRLSVMKRANTVKFVHYLRKEIPTLLKDILQRKFTQYWINLAKQRVDGFMTKFVSTGTGSERYASISTFSVNIDPDEARSELNIILSIKPLRTIEAIHVNIIVN